MSDARRGAFDVVVVWRFDRFARSVKQLVLALDEFRSLGIDFISHQEALDTSTPMGRAMFTIIAAMAELERSVIRERVIAGLEYARQHGTKSGKPVGRPRAVFRRDQIEELKRQGLGWRQIGRRLGVQERTVTTHLARIYRKLGANSRIGAIAAATRSGVLGSTIGMGPAVSEGMPIAKLVS